MDNNTTNPGNTKAHDSGSSSGSGNTSRNPLLDAKISQSQKLQEKLMNDAKVNLNEKLNSQYEYERYRARMNSSQYTDEEKRRFRAESYYRFRNHDAQWIDPAELDRFKFGEWFRLIRKQRLFKFTAIFTLTSGIGSLYAVYDDRMNAQRRHEGIFKDIIRQNVRRKLNGFVELSDDEIEVRFGKEVRDEFLQWKQANGVLIRDIEKKSLTPEAMYQAKRKDVV